MNNIKVGEYGRTNLGKIIKFSWLSDENGIREKNKVILVDLMLTETRPYYYFKKDEFIVKHSKNIIDILEVGDYVNGEKVTKIKEWTSSKEGTFKYAITLTYDLIKQENIKTILTKEQFKNIEYKVEE